MMNSVRSALFAVATLGSVAGLCGSASALTTTEVEGFQVSSGGTAVRYFNKFNGALGTLQRVDVELESIISNPSQRFSLAMFFVSDEFIDQIDDFSEPVPFNASASFVPPDPLLAFFTSATGSDEFDVSMVFVDEFESFASFARVALCSVDCADWFGEVRLTYTYAPSAVPIPAALPLLASGVVGLGAVARKRRGKAVA